MDRVISLLVFSLLPQLVVLEIPTTTSYRAIVELVSGNSKIFSGESLHLRCEIPDVYNASWNYLWFRGFEQLPESGSILQLWNANVKESGKYSCQGTKETLVGSLKTQRSLPKEIHVDGGFVILQMSQHPVLVGETLNLECRLRAKASGHETILYRDGIEVVVQKGSSSYLHLRNVSLEDGGFYSCRASWNLNRRTHSVMSVPIAVDVLEVLTQPVLEIDENYAQLESSKMKLICHLQYNAHAPAPPVSYYFYKNNHLLGPATTHNHVHVRQAPGWYTCRAKVTKLDVTRWSEPQSFRKVTELQSMPLRPLHRNHLATFSSKSQSHSSSAPATQLPTLSTDHHHSATFRPVSKPN